MRKHPVSLKTLAQALNVSMSTVSRALKNHPDIGPEITKKVQQLAQELQYSPNPLAMGLLKNKTHIIGVIVPDLVTYFFSSIISGIESVAEENGYYIVIRSSYESYEKEKECLENLLKLRVEGIIMCLSQETTDYTHFDRLIEEDMPLVFFDRVCRTAEVDTVVVDNQVAACHITEHFFERGYRRIAHIAGPAQLNITCERIQGYKDGLANMGLDFEDELLVHCDMSIDSATAATRQLLTLPQQPDAIFGVNDTTAFAAMKEIKRQGLRIPTDVALVGFSDEFHATVVEPTLTSIMHPCVEIGQEAAHLFLKKTRAKTKMPAQQVILKTHLVIRDSTVAK
ncbi:LacI family DNA-binding transcriptional regulator [Hymenobacter sp. GOD-10R]|uniref:LacI family DNA-binding transcriptional regulator n=1 Tax=Hymenobacter sp. GOD-10R TaxID=3093922 RepID=UPI002D788D3B|nr:LacI family DNA-binding transcriptional regulator [Hymenobacter sp. GOD-10R]WRQ31546.1 LacI family DNA-binding transcriptional regulator [Hymenobacter sp. GOD-10R]